MGVSDFNLEGGQKKNIAYFSSIVRLYLADEIISDGKDKLLMRVAKKIHILEDTYKEILKTPDNYSIKGLL